jgi:two-component system, response regulator YesN
MKTILIIDNDETFLKIMSDWFSGDDREFNTITCFESEKVFDILKTEKVDVIISDVMMEPVSGIEILETLKKDPKTSDIPMFVISQMGEIGYRDRAINLGAEDYLIKADFSLEELTNKIDFALEASK